MNDGYIRLATMAGGRVISYEEARDLAIGIAQNKGPDHFDKIGGQYFHDDKPSCLVGQMLHELGITHADVTLRGANTSNVFNLMTRGILLPEDNKTELFLATLQRYNDSGYRWMFCVKEALRVVGDDPTRVDRKFEEPTTVRLVEQVASWTELVTENAKKPTFSITWEQATEDRALRSDHVLVA